MLSKTVREKGLWTLPLGSAWVFAILRHCALNLLNRHPARLFLKRKRFKADLDDPFLSQLLGYF